MLDSVKVAELATQAARKWIDLQRVIVEPMVDSQGDEALRVTLVLDPKVVEGVTGDQALDVLVDINEALQLQATSGGRSSSMRPSKNSAPTRMLDPAIEEGPARSGAVEP